MNWGSLVSINDDHSKCGGEPLSAYGPSKMGVVSSRGRCLQGPHHTPVTEVGSFESPFYAWGRLRCRQSLVQGHSYKWQSQDSDPGHLAPQSTLLDSLGLWRNSALALACGPNLLWLCLWRGIRCRPQGRLPAFSISCVWPHGLPAWPISFMSGLSVRIQWG